MKVLLTGASGFVGSRVLVRLVAERIPTVILLRSHSSQELIQGQKDCVEVRRGTLTDRASLDAALEGVSHVVHCAGKTKALKVSEFDAANVEGVRNLVEAIGARQGAIRRLVHMSSLAACGPAGVGAPVREDDTPRPISAYGRSKLAGEALIRECPDLEAVMLRPGGVYGPGDRDFLQLFRAVRRGVCPIFSGGRQVLNLVYVEDLARVVVDCLSVGAVPGGVYHVAHSRVVTARELVQQVAAVMERQPWMIRLPTGVLVPLSWVGDWWGQLRGRPGILGTDRRRELMAEGWVCDTTRLRTLAGLECPTDLEAGLRSTWAWYQQAGWL